ncbi:MAG: NUDIX domain-containing protein [Candidatus Manganitrophus sp.]|nr:NUDIX domain-containing protein [Candidatus Manganitrophus sp.]
MQKPIIEVAIAIIVKDGEILVTRRKEGVHLPGLWEFPGGKRDSGETIKACLLREVKEELGATVEIERLFWERSHYLRRSNGDPSCLFLPSPFRRFKAARLAGIKMDSTRFAPLPSLPRSESAALGKTCERALPGFTSQRG